jgi:hypothetical protein
MNQIRNEKKSHIFFNRTFFSKNDITAGIETEFQTAVKGAKDTVDLPIRIRNSTFYKNLLTRTNNGEYSQDKLKKVNEFLNSNKTDIWENSYVTIKEKYLSNFTKSVIHYDFLSSKHDPSQGLRSDIKNFYVLRDGEMAYRFPVSYLLKLALADFIGEANYLSELTLKTAKKLMEHFSNDNTSPEVISFYIANNSKSTIGDALGKENVKRFLFTQLLTIYSNKKFNLLSSGQHVIVYHSPLTPVRQQILNELIPDSFYRELFISPCLSGWDKGEEKKRYMELCHLSLSRSNLNTIEKLKDAGIIKNNLITLPNTSNTCLTNNGIHISIGSKSLTNKIKNCPNKFNLYAEKYYSDLVIKIVEHFLPLLTVNYSASPYRIPYHNLHPEKILGFLPHELDFTHLRMLYRRWMKKVSNKRFGHRFTPVGPLWIDTLMERLLHLKGDYVYDYRVIDYFMSIMSTETVGALDGKIENQSKLKKELHEMGVFDEKLSFYSLYKGRFTSVNGFSGYEGRFYSCFYNLYEDTMHATNLQTFFTALAYKYINSGFVKHVTIPDQPYYESERRQVFFAAALGIPTVYIKTNSKNSFIKYILSHCKKVRVSRRYPSYYRVEVDDYNKALLEVLKKDGRDLIENLEIENTIKDLSQKIEDKKSSTAYKITSDILKNFNRKNPLDIESNDFNMAAEDFYRNKLRIKHLKEGMGALKNDIVQKIRSNINYPLLVKSHTIFEKIEDFLEDTEKKLIDETINQDELMRLITICVADIAIEQIENVEMDSQHIAQNA